MDYKSAPAGAYKLWKLNEFICFYVLKHDKVLSFLLTKLTKTNFISDLLTRNNDNLTDIWHENNRMFKFTYFYNCGFAHAIRLVRSFQTLSVHSESGCFWFSNSISSQWIHLFWKKYCSSSHVIHMNCKNILT
jgi:hypothetical protein